MGLYLCIFDDDDDEVEGVEIGSYADFGFFRETVVATVEKGQAGSVCPVLINHSDCDGHWTPAEAAVLLTELEMIETVLDKCPPVEFDTPWKIEVAKTFGIAPESLLDCFFDVDGEPLTLRLKALAAVSIEQKLPIVFQ